ncbi:MAG TPA: FtsQ-type POTRA domain-containing protein [Candidatus Dojkabacteria bacterium]|nr:FtsQ-type POTRA domain-containing protein [Candidatus Dojkabacteria bacterium]
MAEWLDEIRNQNTSEKDGTSEEKNGTLHIKLTKTQNFSPLNQSGKRQTEKQSSRIWIWIKSRFSQTFRFLKLRDVLIVVGLAIFVFLVDYLGFINIKSIDVTGTKNVPLDQVYALANKLDGQNFFFADIFTVKDEISKNNNFVDKVYVTKIFPDSIKIEISEKNPDFLVCDLELNKYGLVDPHGYIILTGENSSECESISLQYNALLVQIPISSGNFEAGDTYDPYIISQIDTIQKFFLNLNIETSLISVHNDYCEVEFQGSRLALFSIDQPINEQLYRFEAVYNYAIQEMIDFEGLDLRYNKPILFDI